MKNGHKTYLDIAKIISENSYATRSQVGAVIVKHGNILSYGYNGTPSGSNNCCEDADGNTKTSVIHAEANAICKLAKAGSVSSDGASIYCTMSPCIECAKLIIQAGITEVIYSEEYRITDGLELLKAAGIHVECINFEEDFDANENIEENFLKEQHTDVKLSRCIRTNFQYNKCLVREDIANCIKSNYSIFHESVIKPDNVNWSNGVYNAEWGGHELTLVYGDFISNDIATLDGIKTPCAKCYALIHNGLIYFDTVYNIMKYMS